MEGIGALLNAIRNEFGVAGVLIAVLIGGVILVWWWQTKGTDGSRSEVRDSGNSQSHAAGGHANAAGGSVELHQHFHLPQAGSQIDHPQHGSTAARVISQPPRKREEALAGLLPDVKVDYTDSADVSFYLVNKGGGTARVTVKARVVQPHPLFRIKTWYDVGHTELKPSIGEHTVQLVHLSRDGRHIYLNGTAPDSWTYAEAHEMPRPFRPLRLEVRQIVEPHTVERPVDTIEVDFEVPSSGVYDRLGRFKVKRV